MPRHPNCKAPGSDHNIDVDSLPLEVKFAQGWFTRPCFHIYTDEYMDALWEQVWFREGQWKAILATRSQEGYMMVND